MPSPAPVPTGVGQPADLMNRFLARLIDYVLLFVVNLVLVVVIVVGALMGASAGAFGTGGGSLAAGVVAAVLQAAIYLGYFAFLESRNGQTIGKMALKLQTQGPGGGAPTMEQALKRNAWVALGILGIVPIVGGFIGAVGQLVAVIMIAVTINNNPSRQGWHDKFAGGTRVIKIG
jgi:uncharacterized RDD family membrane protein YckC